MSEWGKGAATRRAWPGPPDEAGVASGFAVAFLLAALLVVASSSCAPARTAPPNIVIVYVDDLGWRDVGVQGSTFYQTPNIDQIASRGTRFHSAYANAPNCAPSRASLFTGLYAPRHGIYTVGSSERGALEDRSLIPVENKTVLDTTFVTFADVLAGQGYRTEFLGKWHLGDGDFGPTRQGFERAAGWGAFGSPPGYYWPYERGRISLPELAATGMQGEYLTDRLTDEAVSFIDSQDERPFLLVLSHYAVHTPIQADSSRLERVAAWEPEGRQQNRAYASMIAAVDDGVGRIRDALVRSGFADRTYVIFMSDNGGFGPVTDMRPLRGSKGMVYEGGVRVPLIIEGPGIRAGHRESLPVFGSDLFPTIVDWSGGPTPATDGISLKNLLATGATLPDRSLFWHIPAYLEADRSVAGPWRTTPVSAIRKGRYKLIYWFETGQTELYDLKLDPGEANDLSRSSPDVATELREELEAWWSETDAFLPVEHNPGYRDDPM